MLNSAFHCIFGFLREFLDRMQLFKEKNENSKKKFRHLKNDLKIFCKILNSLEKLCQKFSYTFQDISSIKEEAIILFFKCITQNLIENGRLNNKLFL